MDVLFKLYNALVADELIQSEVGQRIKFYEYPATGDVSGTVIIIDPLSDPIPQDYADDKPIAEDYLIQVDVWSRDAFSRDRVAKRVTKILRENSFGYTAAGPNDHDEGIYRSVRRYTGKVEIEEVGALN